MEVNKKKLYKFKKNPFDLPESLPDNYYPVGETCNRGSSNYQEHGNWFRPDCAEDDSDLKPADWRNHKGDKFWIIELIEDEDRTTGVDYLYIAWEKDGKEKFYRFFREFGYKVEDYIEIDENSDYLE